MNREMSVRKNIEKKKVYQIARNVSISDDSVIPESLGSDNHRK